MYDHERSLVQQYTGKPFSLIGVNHGDTLEHIQAAAKKKELNWRSFFTGTNTDVVEKFQIKGFPTMIILDEKGVIHSVGHGPDDKTIELLVSKLKSGS